MASLKTQLDQARFEDEGVKLFRSDKGENLQDKDDDALTASSSGSIIKKK